MKHIALIIALAIILSVNLSNAESLASAELYVGILEDYPTINHGSAIEHNFWAKNTLLKQKKVATTHQTLKPDAASPTKKHFKQTLKKQ